MPESQLFSCKWLPSIRTPPQAKPCQCVHRNLFSLSISQKLNGDLGELATCQYRACRRPAHVQAGLLTWAPTCAGEKGTGRKRHCCWGRRRGNISQLSSAAPSSSNTQAQSSTAGAQVALVYWSLLGIQEPGHAGRNHLWFDDKERPGSTLSLKCTAQENHLPLLPGLALSKRRRFPESPVFHAVCSLLIYPKRKTEVKLRKYGFTEDLYSVFRKIQTDEIKEDKFFLSHPLLSTLLPPSIHQS